jgi:hypothetical protein
MYSWLVEIRRLEKVSDGCSVMKLGDYRLEVIIYRRKRGEDAGGASILLKQCMYRRKLWQLREVLRDAGVEEREKAR